MQSNKKKQHSSKFKSFYLSCRSHLPCSNSSSASVNPIPIPKKVSLASHHKRRSSANRASSLRDDNRPESVEMQWKRVHELERKLEEVEGWLFSELARLKRHLRSNDHSNCELQCDTKFVGDQRDVKFGRLDGHGGYIYSFGKLLHGACKDLAIQFSCPSLVPPEVGSNISEVLHQMAAMGKENLMTWLLKSMPMTEISRKKTLGMTLKPCNTPTDILEAILFASLEKIGSVIVKGLQIQKGVKEVVKQQQDMARLRSKNGEEEIDDRAKGALIIMAMLIQPRDPEKGYEPVNEMMIGFVEARKSEEEDEEDHGFVVKRVHVAGLVARKRNGQAIHNCLWYVSA